MSRVAIINCIWAVSLMLQVALLVMAFRRGVARRLPVFAALLIFYPLRAIALFVLFGHVKPADYAATGNAFSIVDLVLQFCIAMELAARLIRGWGGWTTARGLMLAALGGVSVGATLITSRLLPAHAPIPADRVQIFDCYLLMLICVWAFTEPAAGLLRRVAVGFGLYGLVSLLEIRAHTIAAVHRDGPTYVLWSYIGSGAYLAVVAFWLAFLKVDPEPKPKRSKR